jgi:hypothetical protein
MGDYQYTIGPRKRAWNPQHAIPYSGWGGCAEATPRHPALHPDETGQSGLSLFLLINKGRETNRKEVFREKRVKKKRNENTESG